MWTCEKISCFRAEWKKSKMGQNRKEGRAQIWGLIPKLMRRRKENARLGILTGKKLQTADGTVLGSGWISRGNSQRKLFFQHFLRRCNDFLARPCSLDRKKTKIRNWWANWENERELFSKFLSPWWTCMNAKPSRLNDKIVSCGLRKSVKSTFLPLQMRSPSNFITQSFVLGRFLMSQFI